MTVRPGDCKHFETANPTDLQAGTEARPTINMRVGEGQGRHVPGPSLHKPYPPNALSIRVMGLSSALAPWNWMGPGKR